MVFVELFAAAVTLLFLVAPLLFPAGRDAALLLLSPQRFMRRAVERDARDNRSPVSLARLEENTRDRVRKIRVGFAWALGIVLAGAMLGWGLGLLFFRLSGPLPPQWSTKFQVGSALVVLTATFALRGWEIQSIDGGTAPEVVNQFVYRLLSFGGTVLLVASMVWATPP